MYLLCSLAIFSMPLLWPSLPAHRVYTLSIPILLPIAHMGLTGISLSPFISQSNLSKVELLPNAHMGLTGISLSLFISSLLYTFSILLLIDHTRLTGISLSLFISSLNLNSLQTYSSSYCSYGTHRYFTFTFCCITISQYLFFIPLLTYGPYS